MTLKSDEELINDAQLVGEKAKAVFDHFGDEASELHMMLLESAYVAGVLDGRYEQKNQSE